MMKFLIPFFLITACTWAQTDCSKFKIGTFQNIKDGIVKARIQRNDSIQTEKYGKVEIKLKIEWIDDCTYRLELVEGNKAFWERRPKDKPTPDLIVKIVEILENSYIQESKFVGEDEFNYRSEITKIEE